MRVSLNPTPARARSRAVGLLLGLGALCACDSGPSAPEPPVPPEPFFPVPPVPPGDSNEQLRLTLNGLGIQPLPAPQPQPPALVALGKMLFFDKVLSGNRDISCGTCHHPVNASADALTLSIGTGGSGIGATRALGQRGAFLARNAPALFNLGGFQTFALFWDGRVSRGGAPGSFNTPAGAALPAGLNSLLAAQAMFPVLARDEMRGQRGDADEFGAANELAELEDTDFAGIWRRLMSRLLAIPGYVDLFRDAFPGVAANQLGFQHAANALAAFEIESFAKGTAAVDRFVQGDNDALSIEAKRGGLLFAGQGRCASCHAGSALSTGGFLNIGVPQLGPGRAPGTPLDWGFGGQTGIVAQRFFFRTASLRNVELTAPYMHNGAYASLEAVVRHYNDVARANRTYDVSQVHAQLRSTHRGDAATIDMVLTSLDSRLRQPMGLTDANVSDIVAFLRSLTDPTARDMRGVVPSQVPSGLPPID